MSAAPNLDPIFRVIEGGLEVAKDATTEVIADNGAKIVDIFTREAIAGNGTTAEVAEIVNIAEGASTGTTEGVALLTQSIQGVAVPAIAVALGTVAGVALSDVLYDLDPQFWVNLSDSLFNAGATVKGKVVAFMDNTGKTTYPQSVIEIVKNALLGEGLFDSTVETPDATANFTIGLNWGSGSTSYSINKDAYNGVKTGLSPKVVFYNSAGTKKFTLNGGTIKVGGTSGTEYAIQNIMGLVFAYSASTLYFRCFIDAGVSVGSKSNIIIYQSDSTGADDYFSTMSSALVTRYTVNGQSITGFEYQVPINPATTIASQMLMDWGVSYGSLYESSGNALAGYLEALLLNSTVTPPEHVQDGATLPTGDPFTITYPDWLPSLVPTSPVTFPVGQPNPNGDQQSQQSGANTAQDQIDGLEDLFYLPDPPTIPDIIPDPDITPIPPDPIPVPDPVPPDPIPPDPNPIPDDSDIPPIIPTPDTSSSSKLFTVYNPSASALNGVGAFLWSSSIMDTLKKIWQNPLDGIISLHKIYTAPSTGGSQNIILGYLDTEVTAPVVTSQFVDVDCGSVTVPENKKNATDYSPFTQLQIYLPFVGIQELDTNEIMGGSINVKYKVDVYTGTCLAMIFVTRSPDKTSAQLLYTFSGNCSQKLPLTSSEFSGAISALLGIVGVGVASGGALGAIAGAGAIAHSLTQDMVHIQHSGGLSANSGILAPRKPFLIIARQYGYDANNYADIYGFPANMTVTLRNCKDFVRVKAVNYKGKGTQEEKQMIIDQLKRGVIV